jgi:serine/threonine protein kinase
MSVPAEVAELGVGDANGAPRARGARGARAARRIGAGTVLGERYELVQLLGRGGMACVYQARDRYRASLGIADCMVAIKIVQPVPSRPGGIDALGREFHNAQRLSHPNVVNVYNIEREADLSFYSMELLDGVQLDQLLTRAGGQLQRGHALAIIRDIGAAIAHAHARGVVHADLKPHNIMVTRDGQVRVLDFGSGIVRPGEPWISELSPGGDYRQATPSYASCEQLQGWCPDPRDDIYALACLAYQLLTGRHPFDQRSSLVARARRLRPRRPPGMRGEQWRALRRGLGWNREQRNLGMERWLQQLGVADGAQPLPPLARLTQPQAPQRLWPQRAMAATAVLCSLGLALFAVDRQSSIDWGQTLAHLQHSWDSVWPRLRRAASGTAGAQVTSPASAGPDAPGAQVSVARVATPLTGTPVSPAAATGVTPATAATPATAGMVGPAAAGVASGSARAGFAAASFDVASGEPAARVVVRRLGGGDGELSFIWWTEGGSAQPDVDYAELGRRVDRIPSGADQVTLFVPIISIPRRDRPSHFYVALAATGNGSAAERAAVTIDRGE